MGEEEVVCWLSSRRERRFCAGGKKPGCELVMDEARRRWMCEVLGVVAVSTAGTGPSHGLSGNVILHVALCDHACTMTGGGS